MELSSTPEPLDLEIWREGWEKQWSDLPAHFRPQFPDQQLFNDAAHARKVIRLLKKHGIHCCVVGTKALRYYGAGRASTVHDKSLCHLALFNNQLSLS